MKRKYLLTSVLAGVLSISTAFSAFALPLGNDGVKVDENTADVHGLNRMANPVWIQKPDGSYYHDEYFTDPATGYDYFTDYDGHIVTGVFVDNNNMLRYAFTDEAVRHGGLTGQDAYKFVGGVIYDKNYEINDPSLNDLYGSYIYLAPIHKWERYPYIVMQATDSNDKHVSYTIRTNGINGGITGEYSVTWYDGDTKEIKTYNGKYTK